MNSFSLNYSGEPDDGNSGFYYNRIFIPGSSSPLDETSSKTHSSDPNQPANSNLKTDIETSWSRAKSEIGSSTTSFDVFNFGSGLSTSTATSSSSIAAFASSSIIAASGLSTSTATSSSSIAAFASSSIIAASGLSTSTATSSSSIAAFASSSIIAASGLSTSTATSSSSIAAFASPSTIAASGLSTSISATSAVPSTSELTISLPHTVTSGSCDQTSSSTSAKQEGNTQIEIHSPIGLLGSNSSNRSVVNRLCTNPQFRHKIIPVHASSKTFTSKMASVPCSNLSSDYRHAFTCEDFSANHNAPGAESKSPKATFLVARASAESHQDISWISTKHRSQDSDEDVNADLDSCKAAADYADMAKQQQELTLKTNLMLMEMKEFVQVAKLKREMESSNAELNCMDSSPIILTWKKFTKHLEIANDRLKHTWSWENKTSDTQTQPQPNQSCSSVEHRRPKQSLESDKPAQTENISERPEKYLESDKPAQAKIISKRPEKSLESDKPAQTQIVSKALAKESLDSKRYPTGDSLSKLPTTSKSPNRDTEWKSDCDKRITSNDAARPCLVTENTTPTIQSCARNKQKLAAMKTHISNRSGPISCSTQTDPTCTVLRNTNSVVTQQWNPCPYPPWAMLQWLNWCWLQQQQQNPLYPFNSHPYMGPHPLQTTTFQQTVQDTTRTMPVNQTLDYLAHNTCTPNQYKNPQVLNGYNCGGLVGPEYHTSLEPQNTPLTLQASFPVLQNTLPKPPGIPGTHFSALPCETYIKKSSTICVIPNQNGLTEKPTHERNVLNPTIKNNTTMDVIHESPDRAKITQKQENVPNHMQSQSNTKLDKEFEKPESSLCKSTVLLEDERLLRSPITTAQKRKQSDFLYFLDDPDPDLMSSCSDSSWSIGAPMKYQLTNRGDNRPRQRRKIIYPPKTKVVTVTEKEMMLQDMEDENNYQHQKHHFQLIYEENQSLDPSTDLEDFFDLMED